MDRASVGPTVAEANSIAAAVTAKIFEKNILTGCSRVC